MHPHSPEKSEKDWDYFQISGNMNPKFIPDGHGYAELIVVVSSLAIIYSYCIGRQIYSITGLSSRIRMSALVSLIQKLTAWTRMRRATCSLPTRRSRGIGKYTEEWTIRLCTLLEKRCVTSLTYARYFMSNELNMFMRRRTPVP